MRTSRPDRPSLQLDDYSGPFQPDLHGLERATDAEIVNHEAGKYSRPRRRERA
jgi:hypothetical protein